MERVCHIGYQDLYSITSASMDKVEKSQQRLQAIAERRQLQEAEEQLKRETDEWLKLAQKKRKSLRDQWFSDNPPGAPPPQDGQEPHTATQKTPEEVQEAGDVREEDRQQTQLGEQKASALSSDTLTLSYTNQTSAEQKITLQQVSREAQMAQRMFHESGQDGRSVLGMVAVQVERDPKTGATVVRSVGPVSAPAGATAATSVFDDGRMSIHAVGGQPSAQELDQVLSAIDGVGMTALLDKVTLTPPASSEQTPLLKAVPVATTGGVERGTETGVEGCAERVRVMEVEEEENQEVQYRMVEDPVTLTFMGYADAASGQEEQQGALTVERVVISEDGEETLLGPLMHAPPQASHARCQELGEGEAEAGNGTHKEFQDVPLNGSGDGVKVQGGQAEVMMQNSACPNDASKHKTCQCCSIM